MNGSNGSNRDQAQNPHLSFLLNAAAAGGQNNAAALMASLAGAPGGLSPASLFGMTGAGGGTPASAFFGAYGGGQDGGAASSIEDQILQRASALRAEALMQQQQPQQQNQTQQQQLEAALAALQQQQQLSSLAGLGGAFAGAASSQQEQRQHEALLARAAALRDLGLAGLAGGPASALQGGDGLERLQQQLEMGRLEELQRARRAQLAALTGIGGDARSPASAVMGGSGRGGLPPARVAGRSDGGEGKSPSPPPEIIDMDGPEAPTATKSSAPVETKTKVPKATKAQKSSKLSTKKKEDDEEPGTIQPVSEKTRDELRKAPGTVIVPCRARGMPMDHNFKTAYFVISEKAKHGEDLVCSYFACRNGGVKFRYCAHCMAPVAKRNFCRRHDHGMSGAKGGDQDEIKEDEDDDDEEMDESERTMDQGEPVDAHVTAVKTPKVLPPARPSKLGESSDERKRKHEDLVEQNDVDSEDHDDNDQELIAEAGDDEGKEAAFSSKRRAMWSSLLARRPRTKDPRNLSSWLNEVLTVSDLDFPVDRNGIGTSSKKESSNASKLGDSTSKSAPNQISTDGAVAEMGDAAPAASSSTVRVKETEPEPKNEVKEINEPVKEEKSSGSLGVLPDTEQNNDEPSLKVSEDAKREDTEEAAPVEGEEKDKEDDASKERVNKKLKREHDGFVGSFADWRDRKKGKGLKKGSGSLRK
eukprot:CAMPEP_0178825490 /NCGR_PEP_ID=MMETSP0746-20121128/6254_1 /TAXON_ID=913974 /ORGANISM="Nitzschia punctata, Strain CCMP561" /LENGTH=700 /DNA_ID=CAMNT_0020487267 /DNA_START=80 /DNA_END=2182 /DNA_ORIENTATION=+